MNGNARKPAAIPPAAAVVTLQGVCSDPKPKTPCATVITREDLDRYLSSSSPGASPALRGRAAVQYARMIALSKLAEKQGLAKNPTIEHEINLQLRLVRQRILAAALMQSLQAQIGAVADTDIHKYYDQHREEYEETKIVRLAVPFSVPTENGAQLDRSAIKAELGELRERAAAGEDFQQLQEQAFKDLHIQARPAPVNPIPLRRSDTQGEETKAFTMKPGEVSDVLDLAASFAVIKVQSRESKSLEAVRGQIEASLRQERLKAEMAKLGKSINAKFNLEYLGLSSEPNLFASAGPAPETALVGAKTTPSGTK